MICPVVLKIGWFQIAGGKSGVKPFCSNRTGFPFQMGNPVYMDGMGRVFVNRSVRL
jgi:hypothetical protein